MRVYVDTNVFYLVLRPPVDVVLERWMRERVDRLQSGVDEAVTSPLVLDELAYRLLLAAVRDSGARDPLAVLRRDAARIVETHAPRVASQIESVVDLPGLRIVHASDTTIRAAIGHMQRFGLLPRDAHHLALAHANGCDAIVSLDADFGRSAELVAWIGPHPVDRDGS